MTYLNLQRADNADYSPGVGPYTPGQTALTVDPSGQLKTRGVVLTDEGGYIANFSNSSLDVSIGNCTFTNGSDAVTLASGSFASYDIHVGDYVYPTSAGSNAAQQVYAIDDTTLWLKDVWAGSTASSSASNRRIVQGKAGVGGTVAVANGVCVLSSGTTVTDVVELERDVDYYPLRKRALVTFSAAPGANSTTYIGFYDETLTPTKTFAWFRITGTSTTQIVCESGWNATGNVTAAETQTSTVYVPGLITTQHQYEVIPTFDGVKFYVDRVLVAFHQASLPHMHDQLTSVVRIVNGGSSPVSYNVTVALDACKNYNEVDISTNETQTVNVAVAPDRSLPIWAPNNTTPLTIDTQGYQYVRFHIPAAGTASVLTPSWSDDGTNFVTGGGFSPAAGGAYVSTITNATAGMWQMACVGRWLRMSAASTQTGGVIITLSNRMYPIINPTTTVTGTVTSNIGTGSLAAGTNLIGDVGLQFRANATGAATIKHIVSAASTNATNTKNAAGRVVGWNFVNTSGALRYVKLHNSASTPTAGSGVVMTIAIPAGGVNNMPVGGGGIGFATGIGYTIVTGSADADATAVGAGDVVGDLHYA